MMDESIVEFKLKGYFIRIDKISLSVHDKNGILFKVTYLKIKTVFQCMLAKINEIRLTSEIK
ncbi:MAG: hypothetical protein LKE36_02950 [Bacilli bacterium]|jgi:hypothetical protein|nr:hypothetical protein [Bacilli bacterium]